jgi:iron(III) transport system substrate-binding protein
MKGIKGLVITAILSIAVLGAAWANAKQTLNVYSSLPENEVKVYVSAFEKSHPDIHVAWVRLSTGQMFARIQAEKDNPQASIWFGGPTATYILAASDGLFAQYKGEGWQSTPAKYRDSDGYWTGFGINYLDFVTNTNFLKKHGLKPPTSWDDLLNPVYKGQIVVAYPYTSGTGLARLGTLISIMGEQKAMQFEKKLSEQVLQYSESGPGGIPKVGLGQAALTVTYLSDTRTAIAKGYPLAISYPKEGTSYTTDCVALLKGGPQPELAKVFYNWLLTAKAQANFKQFFRLGLQVPLTAKTKALVPKHLVDYKFTWVAKNRDRLVAEWRKVTGF